MSNQGRYVVTTFICLFLLIGCSDQNIKNIIYFGIAQSPQNLDPRFQSDAASERISELIYSPLFYFDKNYKAQSNIVNWEKVNPLKYKFIIKKKLPTFHHNKIMSVGDIVATLNSLRSSLIFNFN